MWLRQLNERASLGVARWLAHPSGIAQALLVTALFLAVPFAAGWSMTGAVFWYLAYCTFISFATQFTIAFQNERAAEKLDAALRTLLHLAHEDEADGDALLAQAEAMGDALEALQTALQTLHDAMGVKRPDLPAGA